MRLLITTQKVDYNDDNLGFFHDWIKEFSKRCEKVTVVCLFQGACDLPDNVEVISLGKTKEDYQSGDQRKLLRRLRFIFKFYTTIFEKRKEYDAVFVHMNPEYVVLGGLFWKMAGKRIGLWFTHKSVTWALRIAEKFVDEIFTASKESFRLPSRKINIVGHGIDLEKFKISIAKTQEIRNKFRILTIGRISPSKDYSTLIEAIKILRDEGNADDIEVKIVGGAGTKEQEEFFKKLKNDVKEKSLDDVIKFTGAVSANDTRKFYQDADLFISASLTGSLDKAVLEAMASGLLVASCNDSVVHDIFGNGKYGFIFKPGDPKMLAEKIKEAMAIDKRERMRLGEELRMIVSKDHELRGLIEKIIKNYNIKYHKNKL
jgi:glycosyltransferase involved in cell wall biosynthesis